MSDGNNGSTVPHVYSLAKDSIGRDPDCKYCAGTGYTGAAICNCVKPANGNGSGSVAEEEYVEVDVDELLMELRRLKDTAKLREERVAFLERELREIKSSGWSEERAVKLRRLETVFSYLANVVLSDFLSPREIADRLREAWKTELRFVVPAPIPGTQAHLPLEKTDDVVDNKKS